MNYFQRVGGGMAIVSPLTMDPPLLVRRFIYLFIHSFIICPIAIAYSMGQIIKSVCVCQCVSLSVCEHSHGRIS